MVHDRIDGQRLQLTHDFLAIMLGVRRPGVTVSLHVLEGAGLIKSNRGEVVILDREGLIEATNGAYGGAEKEYQRLILKIDRPPSIPMIRFRGQPLH
jgi:hypothetical protein